MGIEARINYVTLNTAQFICSSNIKLNYKVGFSFSNQHSIPTYGKIKYFGEFGKYGQNQLKICFSKQVKLIKTRIFKAIAFLEIFFSIVIIYKLSGKT